MHVVICHFAATQCVYSTQATRSRRLQSKECVPAGDAFSESVPVELIHSACVHHVRTATGAQPAQSRSLPTAVRTRAVWPVARKPIECIPVTIIS